MSEDARGDSLPDRDTAQALLREYTQKPGLVKHALAVEAALRAYARKHGEDEHAWGLVGLLHDFDYERWPTAEDHPFKGSEILKERGYPEWFLKAILSHASYSGVPRETRLEKTLFACDELCGFLTACALVTQGKSLHEVKVKSVRKKMKSKAFAASVSREDMIDGTAELGVDLDEHIAFVLEALRGIAEELELRGTPPAG
ncbi:MAG: HD domain-containing protein [Planctomycetota bacterium]|jgi:putative nucleotidyltransferase with HDIG domain